MTPAELEKPIPYPCDDSHTVAKISYQRTGIASPVTIAGMVPIVESTSKSTSKSTMLMPLAMPASTIHRITDASAD